MLDDSQIVQVERERERESRTRECYTESCQNAENTQETSEDSLVRPENGARSSRSTKLTYEDIFYRRFKEGRKEGRKATCTDSQRITMCTAGENSRMYGFPILRNTWCRSYLKISIRISNINPSRAMVPEAQTLFCKPHG